MDDFDLYDALHLSPEASAEQVRLSFRELSRLYHPDKRAFQGGGPEDGGREEAFLRVHRAYRILGDDVLRGFYDRYGLPGIRLADEAGMTLCVPERRLGDLEQRVRLFAQRKEELRSLRLLGLQGSFTMACGRRRPRLQYTATSHSVQMSVAPHTKLTLGCASHVQGANGIGVAKLVLAGSSKLDAHTTLRPSVTLAGGVPELDLAAFRALSPHCSAHSKINVSGNGVSVGFTLLPGLGRFLRGSLGFTLGAQPSLSLALARKDPSSPCSLQSSLNLQPRGGEIGAKFKYKPTKGFSLVLEPSLSTRGWAISATCTNLLHEGLTKLQWTLKFRARNVALRLSFYRSGLRFNIPLELWPESMGPVPPQEVALALGLWALPPLAFRAGLGLVALLRPPPESRAPEATVREGLTSALEQQRLLALEAEKRRMEERRQNGLVILSARYGDAERVADAMAPTTLVLDVSDPLMARVRASKLCLSSSSKSTLQGICDPRLDAHVASPPVLWIHYIYGGSEHRRIFQDRDFVMLP